MAEAASRVRALAAGAAALAAAARHRRRWCLAGGSGRATACPRRRAAAAARLVAAAEGVFLDPVFGAKAMAALIAECRAGRVRGTQVFLVSGGAPTLFTGSAEGAW